MLKSMLLSALLLAFTNAAYATDEVASCEASFHSARGISHRVGHLAFTVVGAVDEFRLDGTATMRSNRKHTIESSGVGFTKVDHGGKIPLNHLISEDLSLVIGSRRYNLDYRFQANTAKLVNGRARVAIWGVLEEGRNDPRRSETTTGYCDFDPEFLKRL